MVFETLCVRYVASSSSIYEMEVPVMITLGHIGSLGQKGFISCYFWDAALLRGCFAGSTCVCCLCISFNWNYERKIGSYLQQCCLVHLWLEDCGHAYQKSFKSYPSTSICCRKYVLVPDTCCLNWPQKDYLYLLICFAHEFGFSCAGH